MEFQKPKIETARNKRKVFFAWLFLLVGGTLYLGSLAMGKEALAVRAQTRTTDNESDERANKEKRIAEANKLWSETPKASFGGISGQVLGITKGGDLKPARYATVVLFPEPYVPAFALETLRMFGEHFGQGKIQEFDKAMLVSRIEAASKTGKEMIEELGEKVKLFITNTDIQGHYRVEQIPPGRYTICVIGRAGANEAVWVSEFEIKPQQQLKQDLHSPEHSILHLD